MGNFKMQVSVEVADRDDLIGVLGWLIEHLTPEQWDEYVASPPHSSTLFPPPKTCDCHSRAHKPNPIGRVFLAPSSALMFQAPRQVGEMSAILTGGAGQGQP